MTVGIACKDTVNGRHPRCHSRGGGGESLLALYQVDDVQEATCEVGFGDGG